MRSMSKTSVRKDIEKSVEEADDRDIFEKALDYAPLAGGVAGGLVGRRVMSNVIKRRAVREGKMSPQELRKLRRLQVPSSDVDGSIIFVGSGAGAGTLAGMTTKERYRKK
jgi:hypothetical protein